MSNKLDISRIISHHNSTIQDSEGVPLAWDYFILYLLPILLVLLWVSSGAELSNNLATIIVTAASIFSGLMLNLLVLVNEKRAKITNPSTDDPRFERKYNEIKAIEETYYNISFTILTSITSVFLCILFIAMKGITIDQIELNIVLSALTKLIGAALLSVTLTTIGMLLMILKRSFSLFTDISSSD
ncbi:hypothetical protein [Marinobacter sp.]|uniref:hypothetical protein n=1 Tax=Marinobacter sp. TaxID=50741 RepID=UPI003A9315FD